MAKVYTQGIQSPKGFDMVAAEPVDQRTIVEFKTDLYTLPKVYVGLKVQVLEDINGEILREFKFVGGTQSQEANWPEVTGGSGGTIDPTTLPLQYTSFVFRRSIGLPPTPVGGDYENPIPSLWFDTPPAGADPVWMSSGVMIQNDLNPPVWGDPILVEDSETVNFEYCTLADVPIGEIVDGLPLPPLESPLQRDYWHDTPTATDDHMAIGTMVAGEYPVNWAVMKIAGETGATGAAGPTGSEYKESIVFARTNTLGMEAAVVTGGGFGSPYPTETNIASVPAAITWSDGIPAGDEKVWMSKFTFNNVTHATPSPSNTWTTPSAITDTATTDFEFSNSTSLPQDPTTDPSVWHDIAQTDDIWMATRVVTNGALGAWGIVRIRGEAGDPGQGLAIAGRDTITNILAMAIPGTLTLYDIWIASNEELGATVPGTFNDAYLYVGAGNGEAGTAWDNIGSITGTDGVSFKQSTVFIRAATTPATPSGGTFAVPVPAGWSDGIPAVVLPLEQVWASSRFFADDAGVNAGLVDWGAPYLAMDTVDQEFQYADTQLLDATPLPPGTAPGGVWYSVGTVDSTWMATATRVGGITDPTTWTVLRIRGEQGAQGDTGIPSILASAYFKTNDDISAEEVSGGDYVSPVPTSTIGGVSWTDGIPAGDGAIWFSQVRFEQTDTGTKIWPSPTLIADSSIVEYQFSSSVSEPVGDPIEGVPGGNTWYDTAQDIIDLAGVPRWMAIGSIQNGVWPTQWDKVSIIGETGVAGVTPRTYVPSSMFARCDDNTIGQVTVTGQYLTEAAGVYSITGANPTTDVSIGGHVYEFTDGIPDRTAIFPNNAVKIWMIQGVFNSVDHLDLGNELAWGNPTLLADNLSIDYQYHAGDSPTTPGTRPAEPTGVGTNPDSGDWYDTPEAVPDGAFWLAQKNWADGPAAQWVVYQIRGEAGVDGTTPIAEETWYSTFHPGATGGPIDDSIGTPDSNPSFWEERLFEVTILDYVNVVRTQLASFWKIDKVAGVWQTKVSLVDEILPINLGTGILDISGNLKGLTSPSGSVGGLVNTDYAPYFRPGDYMTLEAGSFIPLWMSNAGLGVGDEIMFDPQNLTNWDPGYVGDGSNWVVGL